MRTLDRKRSFGQVFGVAGHAFEQDGFKFDHEGKQVGGTPSAPETEAASSVAPQAPAEYDPVVQLLSKSAKEILDELPDYPDDFLVAVGEKESATKRRPSVLDAIKAELAQRSNAATAGLLDGPTDTVLSVLPGLTPAELQVLRAAEVAGKNRKGVLAGIDAAMGEPAPAGPDQVASQLAG